MGTMFGIGALLTAVSLAAVSSAWAEEGMDKSAIVIGASYAAGWTPERIGAYRVINRGIGGEETEGMRARFEQDVLSSGADRVMIWGFINNVFRAAPDARAQALAQMREDYTAMLDMAAAHGVDAVLVTEIPAGRAGGWMDAVVGVVAGWMGKVSYQEQINIHVAEGNDWIRTQAQQRGLHVLDFEQLVMGRGGLRQGEYTTDDGSHVTDAAYAAMTAYAQERFVAFGD
jgi:hypothetical protein